MDIINSDSTSCFNYLIYNYSDYPIKITYFTVVLTVIYHIAIIITVTQIAITFFTFKFAH